MEIWWELWLLVVRLRERVNERGDRGLMRPEVVEKRRSGGGLLGVVRWQEGLGSPE